MPEEDRKTDAELAALLAECPASGSKFRHYQDGSLHYIIGSAIDIRTGWPVLFYHRWGSGIRFCTPLHEFMATIHHEGAWVPRFRKDD